MFSDILKRSVFSLLFIGLIGATEGQAEILTATNIYQVATKGTMRALEALKQIGSNQLEIVDGQGNTALCLSVSNNDYRAFNLLKKAGASLRAPCIQKFSSAQLRAFNQGYYRWAQMMRASAGMTSTVGPDEGTGLSTGAIVTIGVGAAAVAGGIALLASGGGGGGGGHKSSSSSSGSSGSSSSSSSSSGSSSSSSSGSSSGGSWGNTIPLDSKKESDYRTNEFKTGNFLSQIGAEYAYSRGFGGYYVDDDEEKGIKKGDPVKVGVLDNGVDINHPDLKDSIAKNSSGKKYGYNFDYGPCRNGDTTHCYAAKTIGKESYLVFYNSGKNDYKILASGVSQAELDQVYASYASDYDWDNLKDDPTPHLKGDMNTVDSVTNTATTDHGTHVAGTIGSNMNGRGMHGVAPYVSILPGIYDPLTIGFGFETAMKTYAEEKVRVINMSFGPQSTDIPSAGYAKGKDASVLFTDSQINAYKTVAENNIVLVKSAGNSGNDYEVFYDAGAPLTTTFGPGSDYDLSNLYITVAAVDKNNKLASYSQICGATQGYCLSAPGGDINRGSEPANNAMMEMYIKYLTGQISDKEYNNYYDNVYIPAIETATKEWGILAPVQNDSKHDKNMSKAAYGYMQGTSMAAPVVTGSVALLMGQYPHLSSQQVVEILFRTANKKLDGWKNDGTWTYKTKDGKTHQTYTSSIYGHGMVDLNAATKPLGDLEIPTGHSTASSSQDLSGSEFVFAKNVLRKNVLMDKRLMVLDDYDRGFVVPLRSVVRKTHRDSDSFKKSFKSFFAKRHQVVGLEDKMSFSFSNTSVTDDNLLGMGSLDMRWKLSDKNAVTFSYRSDILAEKKRTEQVLANPFLDMRESYALTHTFDMNKRISFAVSAVTGKNGFFEGDKDRHEEFNKSAQAFASEVTYKPTDKMALRLSGGVLRESDAVLGMNGAGAFDTGSSQTYFTGAAIEYMPIESLKLTAAYYYGRSEMPKTGSLVNFSQIISDSFALDAQYRLSDKDLMGIQFLSPLRIKKGSARFDLPVARDMYTDTVYRDVSEVSLRPEAREYDLGFYYMHETDDYDWRGELMARFNPDHMADVKPDYRALIGMSFKY